MTASQAQDAPRDTAAGVARPVRVVCPLHGLVIDMHTEMVVERRNIDAAPSCPAPDEGGER